MLHPTEGQMFASDLDEGDAGVILGPKCASRTRLNDTVMFWKASIPQKAGL